MYRFELVLGKLGIATVIVFAAILASLAGYGVASMVHHKSQEIIQEDDPHWNCHTMGNQICGPGKG